MSWIEQVVLYHAPVFRTTCVSLLRAINRVPAGTSGSATTTLTFTYWHNLRYGLTLVQNNCGLNGWLDSPLSWKFHCSRPVHHLLLAFFSFSQTFEIVSTSEAGATFCACGGVASYLHEPSKVLSVRASFRLRDSEDRVDARQSQSLRVYTAAITQHVHVDRESLLTILFLVAVVYRQGIDDGQLRGRIVPPTDLGLCAG